MAFYLLVLVVAVGMALRFELWSKLSNYYADLESAEKQVINSAAIFIVVILLLGFALSPLIGGEVFTIIAALLGPFLAVAGSRVLESKGAKESAKEERKHKLFKVLMATREYNFSHERVQALNVVRLEFDAETEKDVIEAWEKYVEHMNNNSERGEQGKELYDVLLGCMAEALDYKGMDSKNIDRFSYAPPAHHNLERLDANWKNSLLKILTGEEPVAIRNSDRGEVEALYIQGMRSRDGDGVRKNKEKAVRLFRDAAKQGYAQAQNALGDMLRKGDGVRKNEEEAIDWFEKAANQWLAEADNHLGVMYYYGHGIKADTKEAKTRFEKAAKQGFAAAQYNLGLMYAKGGDAAGQNNDEASLPEKQFEEAAKQEFSDAQYAFGVWHEDGNLEELKDENYRYLHHATAQKKSESDNVLVEGANVTQASLSKEVPMESALESALDNDKNWEDLALIALKWYIDAADHGHTKAQNKVRDIAEKGNYMAQRHLGVMYANGEGFDRDLTESCVWLSLAEIYVKKDFEDIKIEIDAAKKQQTAIEQLIQEYGKQALNPDVTNEKRRIATDKLILAKEQQTVIKQQIEGYEKQVGNLKSAEEQIQGDKERVKKKLTPGQLHTVTEVTKQRAQEIDSR